ncbi:MAG: DUF2461 domain-containing protein [bacterium]|nr:DUF2461 domain-containing protein [bacterium]
MKKAVIQASNLEFLKLLKKNNNRDWFNAHKDRYLTELDHIVHFADALLLEMNKHDVIENPSGKKSLFRIYRDVRFSKDKQPYNNWFSGAFKRATKARRGSYYFHIEPGNSFAGGGFWGPEPADLKRVRDEFAADPAPFRKIVKSKGFKDNFGSLEGEQLKTSPKGFNADDPAIDLIRYKQYLVMKKFTDKEVMSPDFLKKLNDTFKQMRPFFNYMSEVLTTDVNGESVL